MGFDFDKTNKQKILLTCLYVYSVIPSKRVSLGMLLGTEWYNLVLRLFKFFVLWSLWHRNRKLVTIQIAGGGQLLFTFRISRMSRSPIDA